MIIFGFMDIEIVKPYKLLDYSNAWPIKKANTFVARLFCNTSISIVNSSAHCMSSSIAIPEP
jgi:hypothetical protein